MVINPLPKTHNISKNNPQEKIPFNEFFAINSPFI